MIDVRKEVVSDDDDDNDDVYIIPIRQKYCRKC